MHCSTPAAPQFQADEIEQQTGNLISIVDIRTQANRIGGYLQEIARPWPVGKIDTLLAYQGASAGEASWPNGADLPMIPISFVKGSEILCYFSVVTTIGRPTAIAAQELRVECLFPADEATKRGHHILIGET